MPQDRHPAAPEQTQHGFDEGVGRRPRRPAGRRVGSFGDGLAEDTPPEREPRRFSEGLEQEPSDASEKDVERRFSEGLEERDADREVPDTSGGRRSAR
jgi:hypothetical protein